MSTSKTTALVSAKNLVAGYLPGINILNGCNLYANEGELVGIIGPNGAGKSTLLKALFGLVKIREGNVTLSGEEITNMRADQLVARGIGFVPQSNNVFPSLTIEENLQMGAFQSPAKFSERFEFVTDLFPTLGTRRKQRAGSLSGGERQMLAIGRALIARPKLLLLDEPSLGLAPLIVEQIFQTIKSFVKKMDLTVVLVEQNAMGALKIADEGIVLNLGSVVAVDSAEKLLNDPAVRSAYLGF
jgi:branched-chain amino acid transport system ATP-binding protein